MYVWLIKLSSSFIIFIFSILTGDVIITTISISVTTNWGLLYIISGILSMKSASKDLIPNFQPNQIVCLEYGYTCLYAAVIQILATRKMCWVRPLLLKVFASESKYKNYLDN